jgi:glycosyltransferase 2 family protein
MPLHLSRFSIKAVFRGLGYLLMLFSFYFLYSSLKASWRQVVSGWHLISISYLLAAFLLTGVMLLAMPLGWRTALTALGFPMKGRLATLIYFRTSIFRYLPGSFWQFTARAYAAKQHGVSLSLYAGSSFLELFFLLAVGGVFSGMGLAYHFSNPFFLLVGIAAGLAVPAWLFGGSRLVSKRWPILDKAHLPEKGRSLMALAGYYLLVWTAYGAAVYFILNAFPASYQVGMVKTIGLNTLAWFIGFLSFSPGGLGIREMGLAMLLPPEYKAIAVMAGLIQRIMEMAGEALLWLIATAMIRRK